MSSLPRTLIAATAGAAVAAGAVVALDSGSSAPSRPVSALASTPSPSSAASKGAGKVSVTTSPISSKSLTASQIYQQDSPGVVTITSLSAQGEDQGTGIVLDRQGDIVTNDHVVSGSQQLSVTIGSSTVKHAATLVGEAADSDLAVIRIDPSGLTLHPLSFADSSSVKVGQSVFAIGNPYGESQTLTTGIISALHRQIQAPDGAGINDAIQTDAALNPGNSGGPLIDAAGHVVGINSQIASDASSVGGGQPGSTGVGFAIASNTVVKEVHLIETSGTQTSTQAGTQQQSTINPYGQGGGSVDPYGQSGGGGGYVIVPGGGAILVP
jgi:putative serine protease PepD